MGNAYTEPESVERKALEYVAELFSPYGLEMRREACSPIHETLLITCPGKGTDSYTLLESHKQSRVKTVILCFWLSDKGRHHP